MIDKDALSNRIQPGTTYTTRRADSVVVNAETGAVESINGEPVGEQTEAMRTLAADAIAEGRAALAHAEAHTAAQEAAKTDDAGA